MRIVLPHPGDALVLQIVQYCTSWAGSVKSLVGLRHQAAYKFIVARYISASVETATGDNQA
jgi:hypothetical protein